MSTTRTATYCDIVIEQTALALDYLKRASGLIIYKSLVPQDGRLIDEYADLTGRTIAPDYRLWLTKIGSGTIDFVFGSIDIQSCIDIALNEAVWLGWDLEPKDAWNRLPFKPNQDLVFFGADCTILDGYGCCPVSESGFLTHIIETVHASSWPMYLIRQILNIAASIHSHEDAGLRDRKTAKALCSTPFQEIDAGLEAALHRAMAHNRTESGQKEYDTFAPKVVQGVTAFAANTNLKCGQGLMVFPLRSPMPPEAIATKPTSPALSEPSQSSTYFLSISNLPKNTL